MRPRVGGEESRKRVICCLKAERSIVEGRESELSLEGMTSTSSASTMCALATAEGRRESSKNQR